MGWLLVTGGAGFIGSHLVDALMTRGSSIRVLDNLSSGRLENLRQWLGNPDFMFIRGDLLDLGVAEKAVEGCGMVFHLAANPEVRVGTLAPEIHYQQNIAATFSLLEAIRRSGGVETLVFTSSSTVYGEAPTPTSESHGPLEPISVYGASKLACEALISAYAHIYGFKAIIYRLANIVGPRGRHGVIHDFILKLRRNPRKLEILGDGAQTKSYLYISDCVEAMLLGLERMERQVEFYNVGSEDQVDVRTIAEIVIEEIGLKEVKLEFTGGLEDGRGWRGDVKNMLLDISKLKAHGWKPKLSSKQAVREAAKHLITDL